MRVAARVCAAVLSGGVVRFGEGETECSSVSEALATSGSAVIGRTGAGLRRGGLPARSGEEVSSELTASRAAAPLRRAGDTGLAKGAGASID
jgi:hypothetical protein